MGQPSRLLDTLGVGLDADNTPCSALCEGNAPEPLGAAQVKPIAANQAVLLDFAEAVVNHRAIRGMAARSHEPRTMRVHRATEHAPGHNCGLR